MGERKRRQLSPTEKTAAMFWPSSLVPKCRLFVHAAALSRVKPRERELLWLNYVEGINHEEIATATGLRALNIKILLFRTLQARPSSRPPGRANEVSHEFARL
jgi:hypothetical protein